MKKFLCALAVSAVSLPCFAAGAIYNADIEFVRVDKSGMGYVGFTTAIVGTPPACVQAPFTKVLGFNTNEAGGKSILATVLAAKAAGRKMQVSGTGTCTAYNVLEDWDYGLVF